MSDLSSLVAQRIVILKQVFAAHPAYERLQAEFQLLLDRRRAEISAGVVMEARGIAVIGASGSGKTSAVARLFSHTPGLVIDEPETARTEVVSFLVPAPATLKFVGVTALDAVGYPFQGRRTEMIIWDMVRQHLRARRTLFLHLDEAQDLMRHQTKEAIQPVVRTLKSLMQTKIWPVGLILSGTLELRELLNHDPQLARRMVPVEFPRLTRHASADFALNVTQEYAARSSLQQMVNFNPDFAARLVHAADHEFGLLIEIVIEAIQVALLARADTLDLQHFAAAFERRSGCLPGLNPFLAADFERINTRVLLQNEVRR
ncbi:TniB family NTP-binding protein [Phyllobacterium sp. 0TCS1.6C]|uniref:TniB family NTP-binding protein n=1 Tax=unclassified Phyllobacterium TaxID=2638441 RepID=UPI002263C5C0|nr:MULTISPECIES: TniB family NTP-binding protein [unclassified Phyllobacterium]MCX8281517.1 TniB family NTP-binding protein [Phyllobacterium sp. 0TCS1.6C]MCX8292887.1 TniB family NTP-binding protein [Phyllobacterium sp. 0TCS1.6A]